VEDFGIGLLFFSALAFIFFTASGIRRCDVNDRNFKVCLEQKKDIDQCKEWAK
jgi:hypothetical protein